MREVSLADQRARTRGLPSAEPEAIADVLSRHRLYAIGGFTPLPLHAPITTRCRT
jgi:hypothetical protein